MDIELSESSREVAARELQETDERRQAALRDLRKAIDIDCADDVQFPRQDNDFLLMFLRPAKFDVNRALAMMKSYVKFRCINADLFVHDDLETIHRLVRAGISGMLKERDRLGRRVLLFRVAPWKLSEFSIDEVQQASAWILNALVCEPTSQVEGLVVLEDFAKLSWSQIWQCSLKNTERGLEMCRGSVFPARYKGYHVVREPMSFSFLFKLVKPFLTEKMAQRIHIHGTNMNSLHKFISPEVLSPSFGGSGEEMDPEELITLLTNLTDEAKKLET